MLWHSSVNKGGSEACIAIKVKIGKSNLICSLLTFISGVILLENKLKKNKDLSTDLSSAIYVI